MGTGEDEEVEGKALWRGRGCDGGTGGQEPLRWRLEPQSHDVPWVPAMEAEVLPSYSWREAADQRMTTAVPEGG